MLRTAGAIVLVVALIVLPPEHVNVFVFAMHVMQDTNTEGEMMLLKRPR